MRSLTTNLSVFAVLAGIATISLAATSGSAFAAKACAGGPVCVEKADGPQTYDSACAAKAAGAKITHLGACQGPVCPFIYAPVCSLNPFTHKQETYANQCVSDTANATLLHKGACK